VSWATLGALLFCFSCRRRRIDGTDVTMTSRDRAMTSQKQVRRDAGVLGNLTSSCCHGRRRRRPVGGARAAGLGLMSVWDTSTDCVLHRQPGDIPPPTTLRAVNPGDLPPPDRDTLCYHHHHHHHHLQQHQQQASNAGRRPHSSSSPLRTLAVRRLPFEYHTHCSRPGIIESNDSE